MLTFPRLANCSDRSKNAKINPLSGEPDHWLDKQYLQQNNYYKVSFDFFVDWNVNQVKDEIWIKRVVDNSINPWPIINNQTLFNWITMIDSQNEVNNLINFSNMNNFEANYMLFKDKPKANDWDDSLDEIVKFNIHTYSGVIMNPLKIQNEIKNLRGKRSNIGPSGLIYGTSSLECYLSNKPDFWPGDADDVLIDSNDNPVALIEYKKHNKKTPIEDQTLMNYRNRDKLKYQSLALLRDRLSGDIPLKMFILYYSTNEDVDQIKLEEIEGPFNNLSVVNSWLLPLPDKNDSQTIRDYCNSIFNKL